MAHIADLIANRNQELEDFKQKKQEERTAVSYTHLDVYKRQS